MKKPLILSTARLPIPLGLMALINYLSDVKQIEIYEEQLAMVKEKLKIAEEELKKAKKS